MNTQSIRAILENRQIGIYFGAVVVAAISALLVPGTTALEAGVNPALALMLFVTFLQVPLADLRRAFARVELPRSFCSSRTSSPFRFSWRLLFSSSLIVLRCDSVCSWFFSRPASITS